MLFSLKPYLLQLEDCQGSLLFDIILHVALVEHMYAILLSGLVCGCLNHTEWRLELLLGLCLTSITPIDLTWHLE